MAGKNSQELDYMRIQNMELRVTLKKTMKYLIPVTIYMFTTQAYLYMETLQIWFFPYSPLFLISYMVEAFFLIYCYALTINYFGVKCFERDSHLMSEMKDEEKRFEHMQLIGWEAFSWGIFQVNIMFIGTWLLFAFGVFRFMPGMVIGYTGSTLLTAIIGVIASENYYGESVQ